MKKNLFDNARRENALFKDERVLYPEFVPEKLFHREKEIDAIAGAFKPVVTGKKPHNVFLTGPTGVGKTTACRFVLRELEEFTDRAKSLYLNCFEYNSRHAVLASIANFLGVASPRRGIATDEIYSSMLEGMKKADFFPVIVLDEADQLFLGTDGQKLLYDLLRVVESGQKVFGLVLISNNQSLLLSLDDRIKSSLAEEKILFDSYSPAQLKDILSERVAAAFLPGAVDKEVVPFIAARCAKLGGDCRIGIQALLKAGRQAEKQNSPKVLPEHAMAAFESVEGVSSLKSLPFLTPAEKSLLLLLSQNAGMTSGKIFELFSSSFPQKLSERRVRDLLNGLEGKKLVQSKQLSLGNHGKTREFNCVLPKEQVLKELGK